MANEIIWAKHNVYSLLGIRNSCVVHMHIKLHKVPCILWVETFRTTLFKLSYYNYVKVRHVGRGMLFFCLGRSPSNLANGNYVGYLVYVFFVPMFCSPRSIYQIFAHVIFHWVMGFLGKVVSLLTDEIVVQLFLLYMIWYLHKKAMISRLIRLIWIPYVGCVIQDRYSMQRFILPIDKYYTHMGIWSGNLIWSSLIVLFYFQINTLPLANDAT